MAELTTDAEIAAVLHAARTIAVLGAHAQTSKPAFYVPDYLLGIRNDRFAEAVRQAGMGVVQDHCMLAEHQRLRLGRPGGF